MPQVSGHAPGWPCWIELATPDPLESRRFYRGLFGWDSDTRDLEGRGEIEVFTMGGVQGPEVGSVRALAGDSRPPSWTCCFRSDDVEGTVAAVLEAGGEELVEPTGFADLGRFALCADPQGAGFAVWNPRRQAGVGVVNEPSAPCWIELATRDIEGARRFYGEVFGWRPVDRDYYASPYTEFKVGETSMAGMVFMDELWPPWFPPHWMPYFEVENCDAAAARAAALGAKIKVTPTDAPPGRFATMTDPCGARLGLITPDPEVRTGFRGRR